MSATATVITLASDAVYTVPLIAPTAYSGLISQITLATAQIATESNQGNLVSLERVIAYANASLHILSAQQYMATATGTATAAFPEAADAIYSAAEDIHILDAALNLFDSQLLIGPNALFAALFGFLGLVQLAVAIWDNYIYYGVCMVAGCGLEFAGYLSRSLATNDETNINYFLCQIITLTIGPVFIMAAIYYLLGQQIMLHGRRFGVWSPRVFSYVFIACDVISLVIQAIGGGIAGGAAATFNDPDSGTNIMVAGVSFQLASMTLFLVMLFDFVRRSYFHASPEVNYLFANFLAMLFNTNRGKELKEKCEPFYAPEYAYVRSNRFSNLTSLVILSSTLFVYTRNVYRVIELSVGWTGYLLVNEVYLLILDATMIFIACLVLTVQHPLIFLGRGNKISTLDMKSKKVAAMETESSDGSFKEAKQAISPNPNTSGTEMPIQSGMQLPPRP